MVSSLKSAIKVLARSVSTVVLTHTTWSQHSARVTVGDAYCITDCFLSVTGVSHLQFFLSQVGQNQVHQCRPCRWLLRETSIRLMLDTWELIFTNPITSLEGKNSSFIVVCWLVITKVTDGLRCGDKWSSTLLNNLEVELVDRLLSQRNFGDLFRQRFLQQVMTRMFPRTFPSGF